ncbi:MAG: hypothetical protein WBN15_17545 [Polyangiales bacterium]
MPEDFLDLFGGQIHKLSLEHPRSDHVAAWVSHVHLFGEVVFAFRPRDERSKGGQFTNHGAPSDFPEPVAAVVVNAERRECVKRLKERQKRPRSKVFVVADRVSGVAFGVVINQPFG